MRSPDEVETAQRSKALHDLGNPAIAKRFWNQPAAAKVVLFHANWCGYCKMPRSALCAIAPPLGAPTSVLFGLVESAAKAPVEAMTGVTANGFPTMVLFGPNNQQISTMRARDARGIISELDATVPAAMAHPSMQYIRSVRTGGGDGDGGDALMPCMNGNISRPRGRRLVPWSAAVAQARSDTARSTEATGAESAEIGRSGGAVVQPQFFSRTYPQGAPLFDGRVGGHSPRPPLFREGPLADLYQRQQQRDRSSRLGGATDAIAPVANAPPSAASTTIISASPDPMAAQHLAVWRARRATRAAGARAAQIRASHETKKSQEWGCSIM
jgi:thiol-disulfide isomerase/thioredoxin